MTPTLRGLNGGTPAQSCSQPRQQKIRAAGFVKADPFSLVAPCPVILDLSQDPDRRCREVKATSAARGALPCRNDSSASTKNKAASFS